MIHLIPGTVEYEQDMEKFYKKDLEAEGKLLKDIVNLRTKRLFIKDNPYGKMAISQEDLIKHKLESYERRFNKKFTPTV